MTQQSYYERVTKPKRAAERARKLAELGIERLPRGPERVHMDARTFHIKFSGDLLRFIEEQASTIGYQAFFDKLVENEFLKSDGNCSKTH